MEKQNNQMYQKMCENYTSSVLPYEILVETLELQNQQIYQLQKKYRKMKQKQKQQNITSIITKQQQQMLTNHKNQRILQRKIFIQQGLKANEELYTKQYEKTKSELLQEISIKKGLVNQVSKDSFNIFLNFREGILDNIMHMQEQQSDENIKKDVQYWRDTYQKDKIQQNSQTLQLQ